MSIRSRRLSRTNDKLFKDEELLPLEHERLENEPFEDDKLLPLESRG